MVECDRLAESVDKLGQRFLDRVFTQAERDYCLPKRQAIQHLAGRFAAKEAVLKVLGTGWVGGIAWTDVEIRNEPSGQPKVHLSGECLRIARQIGLGEILLSISHVKSHAIASAIGLAAPAPATDQPTDPIPA